MKKNKIKLTESVADEFRGWKLNTKSELTGEYIAGLVQADGSFSAALCRKTRGEKEYFHLSLSFTLVQNKKYKDLILNIQKKWGNIGHWYISQKDKTIRYQINKLNDFLSVIIPFFMKHQLRSDKLLSFLHFKYIVEVMSSKAHVNNRQILLSLIVIGSNMNKLGKLGNQIRYLKPEEQDYVINNLQPEGIDTSKLTNSIKNFKQNNLTLDFIKGCFDGDGSLSVYVKSLKQIAVPLGAPNASEGKEFKLSLGYTFTIVQDIHNLSLLQEIKSYFNNVGDIYEVNKVCNIYKTGSRSDLVSVILPTMANKQSIELVKDPYDGLPFIKYRKIYFCCKMLVLQEHLSRGAKLNEKSLYEILRFIYYISENPDNMTFDQYVDDLKLKWLINKE